MYIASWIKTRYAFKTTKISERMCIDATLLCAGRVIVRLVYKYIFREVMNCGMCVGRQTRVSFEN